MGNRENRTLFTPEPFASDEILEPESDKSIL